jgi:hypothetical protein
MEEVVMQYSEGDLFMVTNLTEVTECEGVIWELRTWTLWLVDEGRIAGVEHLGTNFTNIRIYK